VRTAASPAVERGGGISMAPVDALRDSRRILRSVVHDPLEDVRREAATAAPAAAPPASLPAAASPASAQPVKGGVAKDGRRGKSLFLDPTDQGRKCEVCSCRVK
jgi:hypothetical protein